MNTLTTEDVDRIREVLGKYGKLPVDIATISNTDDLYDSGLTSDRKSVV